MTLIDLPGIVRTVNDGESQSLITDIQALNKSYLDNPRCIILAVHAATTDYHNSGILADAKRVDPDTIRTIPVITKPDLIDKGGEGSVLKLLTGGVNIHFKLGFHMTKCRGQAQLDNNMSLSASLAEEQSFSTTSPWAAEVDRSYFGIKKLKTKLAKLQIELIESIMPSILSELMSEKSKAESALVALGEELASADQQRALYDRHKHIFSSSIKAIYHGETIKLLSTALCSEGYPWRSRLQKKIEILTDQVLEMRMSEVTKELEVGMGVVIESAMGGPDFNGEIAHIQKDGLAVYVKPHNPKCDDDQYFSESSKTIKWPGTHYKANTTVNDSIGRYFKIISVGEVDVTANTTSLERRQYKPIPRSLVYPDQTWLHDRLERSHSNDLECFLPVSLFNNIVGEMIENDLMPVCNQFIEDVYVLLKMLVEVGVDKTFPGAYPLLKNHQKQQLLSLAETSYESTKIKMLDQLNSEMHPFTANHYLYENIKKMRNQRLLHKLTNAAKDGKVDLKVIEAVLLQTTNKSMSTHKVEELEIVLDSYGKVASKRIIDEIAKLALSMCEKLLEDSIQTMRITETELSCVMSEGLDVAEKRMALKAKVAAMKTAREAVDRFNIGG